MENLPGLVLLALALLFSVCLNVILCIKRRASLCRDKGDCPCIHICERDSPSQDEGHYFHDLNHHEQQENPHNHHEQQENPIYGNISTDRAESSEVCYEMMAMQHTRVHLKPSEPDLNYASLDLKMAKKRKKKYRHQQDQSQGRGDRQDQLPVQHTAHISAFMEAEADVDAHLPPRDTSTMVSHSSIYLNSQQIAQEAEELERERENVGWEVVGRWEDERTREWKGEQEGEDRQDRQAGGSETACTQPPEAQAFHSDADKFTISFNHDCDQQD